MMYGAWFVLILLLVGIYLVVNFTDTNSKKNKHNEALDILNARFARGEITEDEYKSMKKNILDK